jgi:hypothetical protein
MAQVLCPSCDKPVTQKGLAAHLQKTQNVRCRTVRRALHAPGGIYGTASSLALIPGATHRHLFSALRIFLEFGANQWPGLETEISMHTEEGKLTTIRV